MTRRSLRQRFTDTVDVGTQPLTSETGQTIRELDTDTSVRLLDTHEPESPCGDEDPTRRLRSGSATCDGEKRKSTSLKSVSTSNSSCTSNKHKQSVMKSGFGPARVLANNDVTPKNLSFVPFNIEGLALLYDTDMRLYLSAFDFCLLIETLATSFPSFTLVSGI